MDHGLIELHLLITLKVNLPLLAQFIWQDDVLQYQKNSLRKVISYFTSGVFISLIFFDQYKKFLVELLPVSASTFPFQFLVYIPAASGKYSTYNDNLSIRYGKNDPITV